VSREFKATVHLFDGSNDTPLIGIGLTKETALKNACPEFESFHHLGATATVMASGAAEIWHKSPRIDWVRR